MKAALLKFAPVYDPRIVAEPKFARALMVQAGALEQLSPGEPLPVLVDHDTSRKVGEVREIAAFPDTDGRTWLFASVTLTDPPDWLKRNGGVSWSHNALQTQDVNGTKRLLRGIIKEVSILSPTVQPAEPLARVAWVGEKQTSSPAAGSTTSDRASSPARIQEAREPRFRDALDDYGFRDADDLEAFRAKTNRSSLDRLYEEHMATKRTEPQVLVRHGIGQVLGVR